MAERIYISGPISNNPHYKENFARAEKVLKERGWIVVNPAKIDDCMGDCEFSYDEYMDIDLKLLSYCSAIFLLNGWEKSKGACKELEYIMINNNIAIDNGESEKYKIFLEANL